MPTNTPIFVVGLQRSGTTLLQALLGAHPRIAAPPEMHFGFRVARFAERYGDLSEDANLRHVVHDTLNPPGDLLAECGFDEERIFERVRATDRTMRGVLDAVMCDFAERHGKVRWSEKSPGQSIGQVERLFPDAQIIHIIRDPRDYIASSLATPWTKSSAHTLAQRWRSFTLDNQRRGNRAGPGRFLQLRYEDLTRDPEAVLGVIFGFLGEDYDAGVLTQPDLRRATVVSVAAPWQRRALERVTPAPVDGWRSRLSRRSQVLVNGVVHRELAKFGYTIPSRRSVAVGRALGKPIRARDTLRRRWVGRALRDPAHFERAIREYLDTQEQIIQTHSGDRVRADT